VPLVIEGPSAEGAMIEAPQGSVWGAGVPSPLQGVGRGYALHRIFWGILITRRYILLRFCGIRA